MFSVGQKVVLVDDKWPETVKQLYLQLPVLDTVYVIRAIRVGVKADELIMDLRRVLDPSVLLVGIYKSHQQARRGGRFRRPPLPRPGRIEKGSRGGKGSGRLIRPPGPDFPRPGFHGSMTRRQIQN